jgi:hypothetical protein
MHAGTLISRALALSICSAAALAQTPQQDSAVGDRIDLTTAQRQTIYQSVTVTQKNNAAPTGFRVSVGASVPNAITPSPVPATIAGLIPQTKGLEVAQVEGQVILIDADKKQIVAVITKGPQ